MNDNLFNALDLADIPEVPEDGTHPFVLVGMRPVDTKNGKKYVIEFQLDDEENPFNGSKFAKWFNLPEIGSADELNALDPEDRTKVIRDINNLKNWLRAVGVPEDELNNPDPADYTGKRYLGYGFKRDRWNGTGSEWFLHNIKPDE